MINHGVVRMVVPTSEIRRTNSERNRWWDNSLLGFYIAGEEKGE